MPWIDVGRFTFDLAQVVLISRGVRSEGQPESVTISLASGKEVDLVGEEAMAFLQLFAEFTASRSIGRPPPDEVIPPRRRSADGGPALPRGVEDGGGVRIHPAPDHQEA